jgi:hypothetical protein
MRRSHRVAVGDLRPYAEPAYFSLARSTADRKLLSSASSPSFEGRFDYAAIGTVSNVASRLCDEAKPGQILISPRVLTMVENAVKVEPVGEFELKGIRRPIAAYNVLAVASKTVREPLDSHGFRCSASDIHEPPMS